MRITSPARLTQPSVCLRAVHLCSADDAGNRRSHLPHRPRPPARGSQDASLLQSRTRGSLRNPTDQARHFCLCRIAAHRRSASTRAETCIPVATQLHCGSPKDAVCAASANVGGVGAANDVAVSAEAPYPAHTRCADRSASSIAPRRKQVSAPLVASVWGSVGDLHEHALAGAGVDSVVCFCDLRER